MPFNEKTKLQAKRKANFRCVVCQQPWVEVHHIVPQAEGGLDSIENAAPLCGSCHSQCGGNSVLRKQLSQMRDLWWEKCEQPAREPDIGYLAQKLDDLREQLVSGSAQQDAVLNQIKDLVLGQLKHLGTTVDSASTIGEVLATTTAFATGTIVYPDLGDQPDQIPTRCFRCGYIARYGSKCAKCGALSEEPGNTR